VLLSSANHRRCEKEELGEPLLSKSELGTACALAWLGDATRKRQGCGSVLGMELQSDVSADPVLRQRAATWWSAAVALAAPLDTPGHVDVVFCSKLLVARQRHHVVVGGCRLAPHEAPQMTSHWPPGTGWRSSARRTRFSGACRAEPVAASGLVDDAPGRNALPLRLVRRPATWQARPIADG
jgi:hypothetical protein